MTTNSTAKIESVYIRGFLLLTIMLVLFASTTADGLSGKFFPPDSPLFANIYLNDLFPWSFFVFLGLSWTAVDFVCKRFKGKKNLTLTVFMIIVIGVLVAFYFKVQLDNVFIQSDFHALWASYMGRIIMVCMFSWTIGGIIAFSINEIIPYASR